MKDIPDTKGYAVDELGNVFSTYRGLPIPLNPASNGLGYLQVGLVLADGSSKRFYVHRLVAAAFIPNPLQLPDIDHIDANKANNAVENLRWVTKSENQKKMAAMNPHIGQNLRKSE